MNLKSCILLLCLPASALAASPFDGTWKVRVDQIKFSDKPDVLTLDANEYRCETCTPPYAVKPDGQDHPVTGHGYDSVAVRIASATSARMSYKKAGKVIDEETDTVSSDGKNLTVAMVDTTGSEPVQATLTLKRVGSPPQGKHAISGSWLQVKAERSSGPMGILSLHATADGMRMDWNGQHYEANFDGQDYPFVGDPTHTMVSIKRLSPTAFEETDKRDGKVYERTVNEVMPDGTLHATETDLPSGRVYSFVLDRQTKP